MPVDTTLGAGDPLVTPGFLRFVGELMFGERWQTPLAQKLGAIRGRPLSPATIHRWSTQTRSIPAWVERALELCLAEVQADLHHRASEVSALAGRLRGRSHPGPAGGKTALQRRAAGDPPGRGGASAG